MSAAGTSSDDARWMELAIWLAWQAPLSLDAYSVGAVLVGADGREVSRGFSREGSDPYVHAEESMLAKLVDHGRLLDGATLYSTLEPCSQRKSRPRSCTELVLATRAAADSATTRNNGIARVVVAWREPHLFVADCQGVELLQQAGVAVTELAELAELAKAPNRHLGV
jgi:diaminohydroxyphosphoribosylaminopyrimidine deaminase/5-amino-6-(5-phosphoribosylamino)uracil reductase